MEQKMTGNGGLSKTRLGRMHDVMARHIESGEVPGLVTLVSRDGDIHVDVMGRQAIDGAPMQRDSIFRIASMTKPVTAVRRTN
jgi:CubicO group peptidase (beta-lactamase class C family)